MSMLPVQTFAGQTTEKELLQIQMLENEITTPAAIQIVPNKYIGDGYEVEFKVNSKWPGNFNGELRLTNTGEKTLENWTLQFDFAHEISNIWNAQIMSRENGSYILKNLEWNQDIAPGKNVCIGFTAKWEDSIVPPQNYNLLIAKQEVEEVDYTIKFKVTSDWGQAFNGEISITNNTEETIEDWILEFDFNRNIERFWTAEIVEHEDNHYIIKNAGYNANIKPGQTIKLGFAGNPGKVDNEPTEYRLSQVSHKVEKEIDYLKDTDQDGLTNYLEEKIGTDSENSDTDGDGLPDGYEFYTIGTNPLEKDSDFNGVIDGDEDFDGDGLNNLQEYLLNGNPFIADTDLDRSDDYEEHLLGTKLDERDTDFDGLEDGKEMELGVDPLNPDTNGNGILDGDEIFEITKSPSREETDENIVPTIKIDLPGELIDTLEISKVNGDNWYLPKEMPGYIGAGYEFKLGGNFEEAELTFKFNEEFLDIPGFEPAIYYCDEENQEMVLLENQEVDLREGSVTTKINHFSKYILLNKTDFEKGFKNDIKLPTGPKSLDIIFVIDRSYSMEWNDANNIRKEVSKKLISSLAVEDRVGVVSFSKYAYNLCSLTTNKLTACVAIDSIVNNNGYGSDAGTALHRGLDTALSQFATSDDNAYKIIVALTDGEDTDSGNYNTIINMAVSNDVIIHTVGLTAVDEMLLRRISSATGGEYFISENAEGLREEFEKIKDITVDLITDTDEDGLSDYHEQRIRIFNGTYRNTNMYNPDTDGDRLLDGQEIYPVYQILNGVKTIRYYKLLSDPTKKDSDGDGIGDAIDPEKICFNVTDRTLALVAGLSYSNLSNKTGKTIGELIDSGVTFENLENEYAAEIRDAKIIYSNESGIGWWGDFGDRGLGSVVVQISRPGKNDAIIYGLRGTEPGKDTTNDALTDLVLGLGWSSAQSDVVFGEYKSLAANKNRDYFISGHSLGGRLTQDVIYKVYNSNEGFLGVLNKANIKEPIHSATFNGLGYNRLVYKTLENDILRQYKDKLHNYYYKGDLVGQSLGANPSGTFVRAGKDFGPWIAKDKNGNAIPINDWIYEMTKVHGIKLWHYDSNLKYSSIDIIQ